MISKFIDTGALEATVHLLLCGVVCVLRIHRPVGVVIHKFLAAVPGLPNGNASSSLSNRDSNQHNKHMFQGTP